MKRVCVYAASSGSCPAEYLDAARRLGVVLATNGFEIVYGGGRRGLMGELAEGALASGGRVIGIIPHFMDRLEWGHRGLTELRLVDDMRTRKHLMLADSAAAIALPGGSGTLEELLEAITLKRLGLYTGAIVLVNTRNYYEPLLRQMSAAIEESFMDARHHAMWQVVNEPEDVPAALRAAPEWTADAIHFATR